jgi:hypothetical protein
VLAHRRRAGEDARLVALNFAAEPRTVPVPGRWTVELSTRVAVLVGGGGGAEVADSVVLDAHEGVVLRRV